MRRALLSWTLVFALLAAGFAATIAALNSDLYSAHGFVRSYLEALARHDSAAALSLDGVVAPAGESTALLTDAGMGKLTDIHLLSDVESNGVHEVRFGYSLGADALFSDFQVESAGSRFGLFGTWRFAASPLASLVVSVDNDSRFTANGVASSTAAGPLAVFAPGRYELGHDSPLLAAAPVSAIVSDPGTTVTAALTVTPTDAFTSAATVAVGAFLDECATQTVLFPTGCPFGEAVKNRLTGTPTWSIVRYPTVQLSASGTVGVWATTVESGTAHLRASVTSLLDGTRSTLNTDVAFRTDYLVTIGAGDSLSVSLPAN
jgi:hypothetical protein